MIGRESYLHNCVKHRLQLKDGTKISQRGALGPKAVPMLGGVRKKCPC